MDNLAILLSIIGGFWAFNIITHPYSIIWNSLPQVKTKRIQLFPSIKIQVRGRTIWFHHWFNMLIILGITFTPLITGGFFDHMATKGFLFGGALQGFLIPGETRKIILTT